MTAVDLASGQLRIDGLPRVLLAASVFPFRLARERWAERLAAVVDLGYTAIDVYVPWNFHEVEPGEWDFAGDRDVDHFLRLARDAGLLVLARPGPYICSEWDGGGLPAWLGTRPGLRLRQNEPAYLAEVERWYARVMPILAAHQVSAGGAVALVQLENELDFFDCDDPAGYLTFLRDSARRHGIAVPLVACAGQGDIARAAGEVPGVAPAVNLYPSDESTAIEEHTAYFEAAVRERGLPLLVTETNRRHRTLKRLVAGGVRLLGPYLQTSGWNGEYGTAVNNWGDLLGFMTHDYDFGGVIAPDGTVRADAAEGRRLAGVIRALGPRLAAGTPTGDASRVVHDLSVPPQALALAGGGELLALTRLEDTPSTVLLSAGEHHLEAEVPAGECLLLVREVPLGDLGLELTAATAELVGLSAEGGAGASAVFASRGDAEVLLRGRRLGARVVEGDVRIAVADDGAEVHVAGRAGRVEVTTPLGVLRVELRPDGPDDERPRAMQVALPAVDVADPAPDAVAWRVVQDSGPAVPLERVGVHRGSGRYRAILPDRGGRGLVLRGAADLIEVAGGGAEPGWRAAAGAALWVPFDGSRDRRSGEPLTVTTRTWGHSNFDDSRLPSLRLGALRGIDGAIAVHRIDPLDEGWLVASADGPDRVGIGDGLPPRIGFGGWMSSTFPQRTTYRRTVGRQQGGWAALRMSDGQARVDVSVDGAGVGTLTPLTPLLWLGRLDAGAELALDVLRSWGEPTGSLELLIGEPVGPWEIAAGGLPELRAGRDRADRRSVELPLTVPAGTGRWIRVDLAPAGGSGEDLVLRVHGTGLHLTALSGDALLGRLFTDAPEGVRLKGGRGDLLLVPGGRRGIPLDLLLESTGAAEGRLEDLLLGGPIDRHREA